MMAAASPSPLLRACSCGFGDGRKQACRRRAGRIVGWRVVRGSLGGGSERRCSACCFPLAWGCAEVEAVEVGSSHRRKRASADSPRQAAASKTRTLLRPQKGPTAVDVKRVVCELPSRGNTLSSIRGLLPRRCCCCCCYCWCWLDASDQAPAAASCSSDNLPPRYRLPVLTPLCMCEQVLVVYLPASFELHLQLHPGRQVSLLCTQTNPSPGGPTTIEPTVLRVYAF
jgi:hypothetical protein